MSCCLKDRACRGEHTGILLLDGEELVDAFTDLSVWDLDIILGGSIIGHQGQETVISDINL
jgi:hypothetical protein